jgi:hypothetical protein
LPWFIPWFSEADKNRGVFFYKNNFNKNTGLKSGSSKIYFSVYSIKNPVPISSFMAVSATAYYPPQIHRKQGSFSVFQDVLY